MKPTLTLSIALALPGLVGCDGDDCVGFDGPAVDSVDVGDVGVDQTRSALVEVSARCDDALTVSASTTGEGFGVVADSLPLDAEGSASFEVTFVASVEGAATGTLTLASDDGHSVTVDLAANGIPWLDEDGDGYASTLVGGDDCDDSDSTVNPGADEIWYDGVDQDCGGDSDFDQDGDGVDIPEDCDDTDPDVRPGIEDVVDEVDSDCDGMIDEGPLETDDILITEVMHSPLAVGDDLGEWIEIHNRGSVDLNLSGYGVRNAEGADGFEIDRPTVVPAGGFAVLGSDGRSSRNGGVSVDFVYDRGTLRLLDEGGGVTLTGAGERVISRVAWGDGWPNIEGTALQVDPSVQSEADLANRGLWCSATATMSGGDKGSPGAENTACPRFDADEDGYAVQDGDCDDDDPDVNPGATETWGDGIDNDCNGYADESTLAALRSHRITGSSSPTKDALGFPDALSVGDIDGDGELEVLLGARYGNDYAGGIYILDAADISRSGAAADLASIVVEGASWTNQLGGLAPFAGDVTGDGVHDIVIGGTDARNTDDRAAIVIAGGSGLSSALGVDDAVLTLTGARSNIGGDVHGGLDLDGDGVAELIHGDVGTSDDPGRVVVVEGGSSGRIAAADALRRWEASATIDQTGAALGGADLDEDGYDDLLVSARGNDSEATNGGAVFLVSGAGSLPASGSISSIASARMAGDRDGTRLGEGAAARLADLDGDGSLDVLIGAPAINRAYVWLDAGALSGVNLTSEADHVLEGPGAPDSFGVGLATADVDGDGIDEAIVGAADDLTAITGLATDPGEIFIFDLDGAPSELGPAQARATIRGAVAGDAVGQSLLGFDLDGDGVDELLVGATGEESGAGSVSLISF